MYNGSNISLKNILWKVFNNPHAEGLNYDDAAEYAIEALNLIGTPLVFIELTTVPPLKIVNYKAGLPINLTTIRGVKLLKGEYTDKDIALRKATDLYHSALPCEEEGCDQKEFTYVAQNGVIQTSVKEGELVVAYTALATDDEGYPLVPDNPQVKLGLEYYILFRFLEPLWTMGKITDKVFQYIDQKKCFYMGAANTSMQLQGIDHLESVMNAVNRLIVNDKAFSNFYKGAGKKEIIRRYS